jgi:dimethylglycine dehydrogenase
MGVLVLAGPKARDLMSKVSSADFSNESFPWLSSQKIDVGLAPTIAMRMNFVGELGWELHHSIEYQNHIFDRLMEVGKEFKLKPFGIRAMDSLRIEKTYKLIGTEMSIEYSPFESSLDRFVHLNKGNFIGRDALVQWQQKGFQNKLVTLEVKEVKDADTLGNNPIYKGDKVIGRATGGNYGFRVQKSLAIGMVQPDYAAVGSKLTMDILGTTYDVEVIQDSPYDPDNNFIRA